MDRQHSETTGKTIVITGVAGFIGSQLADVLLRNGHTVIGIDDFSRGKSENLTRAQTFPFFELHEVDLADEEAVNTRLLAKLEGRRIDEVWHLAANSDIPAGVRDMRVDLRDTFMTTVHTLMLMKRLQIRHLAFASTSAVYGENPALLKENTGPLLPISNYGAMKLASEAVIAAAAESYLSQVFIFRFPNVIGPRLTHGIIYDLLRKLEVNPLAIDVLGDGTQQKPYLHSTDLIDAMLFIRARAEEKVNLFNIGPEDSGATVAEIAQAVVAASQTGAAIHYTGGDRGWVGDVPRFRYSVGKLAELGWSCRSTSAETVQRTVAELTGGF
jgi:UDP-glucose 4-epimerase